MISRAAYREHFKYVIAYDLKPSKEPNIVFSTMTSCTPEGISEEMNALAKRSRRVEKPCAHYCFSLAPGESLSNEQWEVFFAAVVKEFGAMQAFGVTHADTPQVNAHLVMNRVKFDGKAWSTSNDRKRLRSLCGEFERKLGLRILPERSLEPRVSKTEIEKADRLYRQCKAPTPIPARLQLAENVRATLAVSQSPSDFTAQLEEQGITVRWRLEGGKPVGISFGSREASISGRNAGVSVRVVREHFLPYEHNRISPPGSPTPFMVSEDPGGTTNRVVSSKQRVEWDPQRTPAAERRDRETGRDPIEHCGNAEPASQRADFAQVLAEAGRFGRIGLLGLLDLLLTYVDEKPRSRRNRRQIFPLPLATLYESSRRQPIR